MNKPIRNILIICGIFLICMFLFFGIKKYITGQAIKEQNEANQIQEDYKEWLAENCKCLERKIIECPEGYAPFEDKPFCYNQSLNKITNRYLICSKYECKDGIRDFNFDANKWDIPNEFIGN